MKVTNGKIQIPRRQFLTRAALTTCIGTAGSILSGCRAREVEAPADTAELTDDPYAGKTILTFYVDDTNPYVAGAEAFKEFLDFVSDHGLGGESSVILGYGWEDHGLLSEPQTDDQRAFIEQVQRAFECGIDTHLELMTHAGLFDFASRAIPIGAQHEGIWLHEPDITQGEYESYFGAILDEGEKVGIRFTGVTWPGCGCDTCELRYRELLESGGVRVNPNLWKALLNLAVQGRFRGKTVPCFVLGGLEEHPVEAMAKEREFGVYDLYPHGDDHFGIWENDPQRVDADFYISEEGDSGRIAEKVRAGASHCVLYAHWQGLNPSNGLGWDAFRTVVSRVEEHLSEKVIWMRPSALTDLVHQGIIMPTPPA